MSEVSTEDRFAVLRAQLEEAEHAVAGLAEDAEDDVRAAAEKARVLAEKALAKAHLEAKAAAEKVEREVRVAEAAAKAAEEAVVLSLQESNQSASTQNVRGTEALTPEEHAARRNPTP